MILNEENSNSSSSSSAATTTNSKSPMMSKLKTHNSTPKLAHKSMIYPKAEASSKTVNEAMRMMNGSDTSLKNNSSSICSSISSSSSTSSSSSSSTNSSIYQNHNSNTNHTHNNPDCYIHAPKSSQTLIKYVHPTTTSVVSGGVAVVKQKSLSPANICLSKSSHSRSNGDATINTAANPNSVTYRHKSVNVIERTPQIVDETTNNPMKLVYNYNANRLSSYDNDVFSNFCSGQNMTDPGVIINDEMMPTMTTNTLAAVNREQEYMNTMSMLPMKQRAASQSISTQTNKSNSGGTNVFSRALNYARQKASPSVNRAGNGTEQGNNKSSSSSTWRSKLTKYLTQSSSPPPPSSSVPPSSSSPSTASSSQHHQRRKRANRRKTIQTSMELNNHRSKLIYHPSSAHNYHHHHHYNDFDDEDMDDEPYQDGCDILLDENDDIYSSYHLSRRQTATTNNLITATIKQPHHHYNYQHHQQQHNQQQSKLLSISSGLLSLSSSASSTTSSAANNNNNNNHNSVAPTTNALSSASVASSSAASDFIGVVAAAANSRQSPQIVDLTSKSTRSPSQNFSKSSKQRINNGFNSLRRILKLNNNNNNPTSNHYHNNNSSNQTLKEPIALNTPPLNHRLAKRTSTLDYSKSMMSTHQPQMQQQQQQQQQSTSKNMFTMTLNRHMSGACGSSASCEEHKSTMVKKKDKLKKQMSFSAVSSSMKVDMIANNRCATSAAVAARSAHSMSLTDDALSHVNNTNQAQNSGNSSRVMNMLRVYKNVLSKISRTPSHCQTPAATSTSTTPASSNTLSLMNCANPRSSHHNHNTGTTPGAQQQQQNHPITNSVVSFTSAVNLKPNSSSCLQIQMPIATKQLAAQLNCSGRTNSGGNNTSTNSSSSSSSILFPVMVAPTLPYQQPIQIVSQNHSVENNNNNKLVSLANSPKTFATIHNPSSAHMMSESSNGTATLYENNTGGYRSVSVHIEATSTRRKNSNTKSPSYDVEEDLACDLEVASFFDKKRRGDVEYGAEEEYDDDDDGDVGGGVQEEPMMGDNDDYYSTTTYEPPAIINGVGGGENGMLNYNLDYDDDDFNQTEDDEEHDIDDDDDNDQDEEDSQNLDYLVRQLVAEASLSNLNINMDSRKQQQQQQNQLYENRSSFPDLNRSEFVDDDNLDSSSGNENHQQQQRRQVVMDSESELSLVEVEIPSGIMTTTAASSQQQQHRRPSSSYSRLESLTSKLNTNVTPPQPAPPIITDSPHSQSGAVKLEKRIRLNYRKQPNLNNVNLLNFGTLC